MKASARYGSIRQEAALSTFGVPEPVRYEIAAKLRKSAGLPEKPTGKVAHG